jgi:zinc protease
MFLFQFKQHRCLVDHFVGFFLAAIFLATAGIAKEIRVADRVFVVQDRPGSPVEFQMIVNAGCSDEADGQCKGLAHYLEHLVLVGRNAEHGNSAFRFFPDAITNGWTNQVATVYWHRMPQRIQGPREDLEKIFNFYAARLRNFEIPAEEAARERNVVLQEHDWRYGSDAVLRFLRKLDRALMPDHPLGQWTIGTPETIRAFTLDDARAFHERWYKRSNVWFVVTGDVDPALIKEISDKALAGADSSGIPPRRALTPPRVVPRRDTFFEQDSQTTRRLVVFEKLIRIEEKDKLATMAAATIVGNLIASQLPGSLYDAISEREKLTTTKPSVSFNRIAPETYKLLLAADVNAESDPQGRKVLAAIGAYVDGLAASSFSDRNVERLRKRWLDARKTADGVPAQVFQRLIGWIAQGHDPDDVNLLPQRIEAVGKADVDRILSLIAGPGSVAEGVLGPKTGE